MPILREMPAGNRTGVINADSRHPFSQPDPASGEYGVAGVLPAPGVVP
jgi:hypothetical protein